MKRLFSILLTVIIIVSCERNDIILAPESEQKGNITTNEIVGFYLLNEGNMGSNKATLDFYDYTTATYTRNIYAAANPNVAQELGDVGNDIQIYGSRMYATINCSNFVEVMDAQTAKHIGTIQIPNCRHLCFNGQYGYITSYAGPIVVDATKAQIGFVAKFDTTTLQIVDTCHVGFQPDELAYVNNKLYVANSGGYMVPNYENTISVIDLDNFKETKRIKVVNNLHRIKADKYKKLWVSSRGDYYEQRSKLYCIDANSEQVVDSIDIPATNMWLDGDSLYTCSSIFNYTTMSYENAFYVVNVVTHQATVLNFDQCNIERPYSIAVNPITKDIYLTDASDCVTPGTLWCTNIKGEIKWSVRTGDIPAHFTFLTK